MPSYPSLTYIVRTDSLAVPIVFTRTGLLPLVGYTLPLRNFSHHVPTNCIPSSQVKPACETNRSRLKISPDLPKGFLDFSPSFYVP